MHRAIDLHKGDLKMKASTYLWSIRLAVPPVWPIFAFASPLLCFMFCFQLVNVVFLFSPCLLRPYVLRTADGKFIVAQRRKTENGMLELELCTVERQTTQNGAIFFLKQSQKHRCYYYHYWHLDAPRIVKLHLQRCVCYTPSCVTGFLQGEAASRAVSVWLGVIDHF